jgi:hypothetical protein
MDHHGQDDFWFEVSEENRNNVLESGIPINIFPCEEMDLTG